MTGRTARTPRKYPERNSADCPRRGSDDRARSPLKRRFKASNRSALKSTMATTQRVQQFRTRQRTGKILLTIQVDEVLLVEALVESRPLYQHLADDRGAITRALEKAVAALCKEQTLLS